MKSYYKHVPVNFGKLSKLQFDLWTVPGSLPRCKRWCRRSPLQASVGSSWWPPSTEEITYIFSQFQSQLICALSFGLSVLLCLSILFYYYLYRNIRWDMHKCACSEHFPNLCLLLRQRNFKPLCFICNRILFAFNLNPFQFSAAVPKLLVSLQLDQPGLF